MLFKIWSEEDKKIVSEHSFSSKFWKSMGNDTVSEMMEEAEKKGYIFFRSSGMIGDNGIEIAEGDLVSVEGENKEVYFDGNDFRTKPLRRDGGGQPELLSSELGKAFCSVHVHKKEMEKRILECVKNNELKGFTTLSDEYGIDLSFDDSVLLQSSNSYEMQKAIVARGGDIIPRSDIYESLDSEDFPFKTKADRKAFLSDYFTDGIVAYGDSKAMYDYMYSLAEGKTTPLSTKEALETFISNRDGRFINAEIEIAIIHGEVLDEDITKLLSFSEKISDSDRSAYDVGEMVLPIEELNLSSSLVTFLENRRKNRVEAREEIAIGKVGNNSDLGSLLESLNIKTKIPSTIAPEKSIDPKDILDELNIKMRGQFKEDLAKNAVRNPNPPKEDFTKIDMPTDMKDLKELLVNQERCIVVEGITENTAREIYVPEWASIDAFSNPLENIMEATVNKDTRQAITSQKISAEYALSEINEGFLLNEPRALPFPSSLADVERELEELAKNIEKNKYIKHDLQDADALCIHHTKSTQALLADIFNHQTSASIGNSLDCDSPIVVREFNTTRIDDIQLQGGRVEGEDGTKISGLEHLGITSVYNIDNALASTTAYLVKKDEHNMFVMTSGDYNRLSDVSIIQKIHEALENPSTNKPLSESGITVQTGVGIDGFNREGSAINVSNDFLDMKNTLPSRLQLVADVNSGMDSEYYYIGSLAQSRGITEGDRNFVVYNDRKNPDDEFGNGTFGVAQKYITPITCIGEGLQSVCCFGERMEKASVNVEYVSPNYLEDISSHIVDSKPVIEKKATSKVDNKEAKNTSVKPQQ